jgi:hypothetical protein
LASFPVESRELADVLADEFVLLEDFPNALLTKIGVSYFTSENPDDYRDIL